MSRIPSHPTSTSPAPSSSKGPSNPADLNRDDWIFVAWWFGIIAGALLLIVIMIIFTSSLAEAQERPNHSPERLELIRGLQEQDIFLAEETFRIVRELASRDQFSFSTARQAIAWVRSQQPLVERIEEITQERRRNLSALYCSEFDRHNSLGLYSLGRLGLETSGLDLWPSERLHPWENVEAFFWNVESVRRQAVETSQNVYHAYVVIEAFGSDCAPFVGVPLPPKEE